MKPIRLEMTAFGPYLNRQVLDFRKLGAERLFLITGPTGAGKTTVLDAICFALYGCTSGRERDGVQMRHGLAPDHLATEVTFDFAIGQAHFRVRRSPKQRLARKEGGRTADREAAAALWRREADTPDHDDGQPIEGRNREATNAIAELLGFSDDQFRQVIMLPQGQFRRVLSGTSEEREKLLRTLFRIDLYGRIQEELKARYDAARSELAATDGQRQRLLRDRGVETAAELEILAAQKRERAGELDKAVGPLHAAVQAAQAALIAGSAVGQQLREFREAARQLAALEAMRPEMEAIDARIRAAHAASSIRPVEEEGRSRRDERDKAGKALETAQALEQQRREALARAVVALEKEQAREPERAEARRRLVELESLRAVAEEVGRLDQAVRDAAGAAETARRREEQLRGDLEKLDREHAAASVALDALRQEATQAASRRSMATEATRILQDFRSLATKLGDARRQVKLASEAQAKLDRAEGERRAASEELTRLEELRARDAAATLAEGLSDGLPCPVCGALHHPAPATHGGAAAPATELERLREVVKARGDTVEALRAQIAAAREAAASHQAAADLLAERLGPRADAGEEPLREAETKAREAAEAAERAAAELPKAEAAHLALGGRRAAAAQGLEGASAALQQARVTLAQAEGALAPQQGRLPEALRPPGALARETAAARLHGQQLEEALKKAGEAHGAAAGALASAESKLAGARERVEIAEKALQDQRATMQSALKDAGFSDFRAYEAAWKDFAQVQALTAKRDEFQRASGAARERHDRAAQQAAGLSEPELPALEKAEQEARASAAEAERQRGALARDLEMIEETQVALGKLETEAGEKRRFCEQVIGPVALALEGRPPNTLGVSLQRFCLAAMMEEVLEQSTRRLRLMSRGRYDLRLCGGKLKGRQLGGLDLEVLDDYTGKARPVATLSGGESFLASLALALGLADVVQARTGGVRLETIFIDEGFGSLDPESLELAMRALQDLQESGRLVGAISHVEEMRLQIPARLEVVPGRVESRARFVVHGR